MTDLIKEHLSKITDENAKEDLTGYIEWLERTHESEEKMMLEQKEMYRELALFTFHKDKEIARLEKKYRLMKCCGNCEHEKFLNRIYDFTICNECHGLSNWSLKKQEEEEDG